MARAPKEDAGDTPAPSKAKGRGAQHPDKSPDSQRGLWPNLLRLSNLWLITASQQEFEFLENQWRHTLDNFGLCLLRSKPDKYNQEFTIFDPNTGERHSWTVPAASTPAAALATLFCVSLVPVTPSTPVAPPPPLPPQSEEQQEPPQGSAEVEEDPIEGDEFDWDQPARAVTIALANKLRVNELLSPQERVKAGRFMGRTHLTEGEVMTCIRSLESQIEEATAELGRQ